MKSLADEALMAKVKHDADREAFTVLMTRHKTQALRLALLWTGDYDDASDAAQEAFVKVFSRAGQYDEARPFWPWFVVILRNSIRSLQRARLRRRKVGAEELVQHLEDPRQDTAATSRLAELWAEVLALPPKLREVMVLRHRAELNYEQIAATLGVPTGTVARRLHEARRQLAKHHET
jgi:RNA polymerase sigma factor (sigma-70 family)